MMREQMSAQLYKELYAGTGEIGFFRHVRADVAIDYPKAWAVIRGTRRARIRIISLDALKPRMVRPAGL